MLRRSIDWRSMTVESCYTQSELGERASAESVAKATDPSNLIRIMPAQGTRRHLSNDSLSLAGASCTVNRETLASPIVAGKIPAELLNRAVLPYLGAHRSEVLVGPAHGADAGVVDLGGGQVLTVTSDPFFVMRELGWERAAWFAVQIVASDAATTGIRPAYMTVDLNLPPDLPDSDLADLWMAVHHACEASGLAVVTGHTGRYDGCAFPTIGGATVLSVGSRERYVTPAMARPGDALLMTKGAAIETTGMFGVTFPALLRERLGPEMADAAGALFASMTVVPDAMAAVEAGVRDQGVTAMHDATERGVYGGLVELAEAADAGMVIDRNAIPVLPETRAVCELFDMDPYTASSEGTLLIACRPHRTEALLDRLGAAGVPAAHIGELTPPEQGVRVCVDGVELPLEAPHDDPFWPAYAAALAGGTR
jgi:hydrogenase expression/formation protein HypE